MANVFDDDWDVEQAQPGFTWKRQRLGVRLGAEKLGASVYELPPGERICPFHVHHANEELLVVLEGTVRVLREDGEEDLGRGEVAVFPAGPGGGRQVRNDSDRPARVLMLSTMIEPEIVEYPAGGKVGLLAGAPPGKGEEATIKAFLRRDSEVDYFEGEPADPDRLP